ncbi:M3 family oligoendopeptidase [Chitinophaga nivalis]|uniref:M3 family oligoendopeptidase n=1 Tax=Chitinophaga nivalis TaxID=2991709 RepID=A0ABT3IUM3_9BACT|nr:M3 family oligoendopeptidase [Chitinophaga nivalis]MCW3462633.1 M3 family oligoendopeptidase [Chitinophaga nivalis]MCW3487676.1 M3 family oligoendopeptidase [Chitinophaga nivalis]
MTQLNADIKKLPRHFLPEDFSVTTWEALQPYFEALQQRPLHSVADLEQWLKDMSELEAVTNEDACWRQIRMTCDTTDKKLEEAFAYYCMEIQPQLQPYADALNKKLLESPYLKELDQELYKTYLRNVEKQVKLFREENIPIQAELSVMAQQYGAIAGKMTITVKDQEYTLQQAAKFLENSDRALREEVFAKTAARRLEDRTALDELYSNLIVKRDQIAKNAGFANYRDYKFEELGRFDYTKEDSFQFHDAIKEHILPLVKEIYEKQKNKLQLDTLKPWDTDAEPAGIKPLEPFHTGEELVTKAIATFDELGPFFGNCLRVMKQMGHLDLESRKGKAPGGYNCPLPETGVPFIFMNAAGQMKDLTTMVHEGGHAVHSFLSHHLALSAFKEYPMEIAEVASMSMELFTMDHWDIFFDDAEQLRRARLQQLERAIVIFPWIATIDKFQHWIYENPQHTAAARTEKWVEILNEFSPGVLDWSGHEDYKAIGWQKQLHLFEVPFYYIEYGIAQLGAIAMWKQYRENKTQALDNYVQALSLGNTKTLPELYKAAGIRFDFSPAYVKELADFVKAAISAL